MSDCPVKHHLLQFVLLALSTGSCVSPTDPIAVAPAYQWVQLVAGGATVARAILDAPGAACPEISTSGAQGPVDVQMTTRPNTQGAPALPSGFTNITICEATVPPGQTSASLNGDPLPLPGPSPQSLVLMGDTGCRISSSTEQNCDNASDGTGDPWLFKTTITEAVKQAPDLVVHVGDYIYREAECTGNPGCQGSPYGQNWETWETDFFKPAAPLLKRAPWVFARGNHESCLDHGVEREWRGWFLFQGPDPLNQDLPSGGCSSDLFRSRPFKVALGDIDLLMLDSADKADLSDFQDTLNLHADGDPSAWLVTHRPPWGVGLIAGTSGNSRSDYFVDQPPAGLDFSSYPWLKFAVVGHLHIFEWFEFSDGRPAELLVGGGGTELDPPVDGGNAVVQEIVSNEIGASSATFIDKFTFVQMTRDASGGWAVSVKDVDGTTEKHRLTIAP